MSILSVSALAEEAGLRAGDVAAEEAAGVVGGLWADWLEGFGEFDGERMAGVLGQIRKRIQGGYEVDLAPVKQTARMLAAVLRGADHFVPRLKPIFESMQVPVELVWVAEVESAFDPRAISPVGAAGLYQLMPATARQYGLVLEPEDDRFHPEKNARAAARHMSYLRWVFDDWHLAMAAYNAGHNRVRRLLVKHHARSFEEIALHLPLETQLFVPKVDATLVRREGVSLAGLPSRLP